jgi:hypothetical protein
MRTAIRLSLHRNLRDFADDFISGRHAPTNSRVNEFWPTIERRRSPAKINVCDAMRMAAPMAAGSGFATKSAQGRRSRPIGVCRAPASALSVLMESEPGSSFLIERDLFQKPVSPFHDYALTAARRLDRAWRHPGLARAQYRIGHAPDVFLGFIAAR